MKRPRSRRGPAHAAALLLLALTGCWGGSPDGLPRKTVDGMVIFDGAPLASGAIQFEPDPSSGPEVPVYQGGPVSQGQFVLTRETGLLPGRYRVRIYADTPHPPQPPASREVGKESAPTYREMIPARYNAETTLSAEIKPSGFNSLTFVLTK